MFEFIEEKKIIYQFILSIDEKEKKTIKIYLL